MNTIKRQMLRQVAQRAAARAAALSRQYIKAAPEDREAIMAGIRFEKWLSQTCRFCLD
ncbi:MAG: hypothetical protein ACYSWO_04260 [Planctomycetota bacterium]|jgi:hypothetical protein